MVRMRAAVLVVLIAVLTAALAVVGVAPGQAAPKGKPPKPVITKVDPKVAATTGGTVVTIKGKNLKTASKVLFGKAKGTKLKVKSDKKLTVIAPAHAAGVVDVRVKTKGGKSAKTSAGKLTYAAQKPSVTAVSPASGPATGGTRVTVTGTGFVGVTAVTFDGIKGSAVAVSSPTTLQVTSPEYLPRLVHINVTNAAGTSPSRSADLFRFLPAPRALAAPVPGDAAADPDASLTGVDCPAEQKCWAVGSYLRTGGTRTILVETRTGASTWTPSSPALPASPPGAAADLVDIDCATPTYCVAVGTYTSPIATRALLAVFKDNVWTTSAAPLPTNLSPLGSADLVDVDCASTAFCVAVGGYTEVLTGSRRGVAVRVVDGAAAADQVASTSVATTSDELEAVDCFSAAACVAVGEKTAAGPVRTAASSLWNGSAWGDYGEVPLPNDVSTTNPDAALRAVSCSSATSCTAMGSYEDNNVAGAATRGFVAFGLPGAWLKDIIPLAAGADADPDVAISSISCVEGCAAVGYADTAAGRLPLLVRTGPGVASEYAALPASTVPSGSQEAVFEAVECATRTECTTAGSYLAGPGTLVPLAGDLTGITWATSRSPLPSGAAGGFANDVAVDNNVGVAVGQVTVGAQKLPLIQLDLPL